MISSLLPSEDHSCSGSPLMFWKGSTAIDGLSGKASGDFGNTAVVGSEGWGLSPSNIRMDPYRSRNILDLLLAHVLERKGELVAHLITHHPADADPTGLGQGFEPRCDIDPIAINIEPVLHNVADIDPHAELYAAIRQHIRVS